MRWLVEVSSIGKTENQKICVEAESWQRALQSARGHLGEEGPMSGFSIELLEEGYRAVDPVARVRFVVKRASDETPVTFTEDQAAARSASAAPAAPNTEPQVAPPAPSSSSPAGKSSSVPPRPDAVPSKREKQMLQQGTPGPALEETAPAAERRALPAVGSSTPGLPAVKVLTSREQDPTDASPLTYREYAFAVPDGTSEEVAVQVLRAQLRLVEAHLEGAKTGKLVNLAVFDFEFTGKPPRAPLATLTWKDWKGEPVVAFPRNATPSKPPRPPETPSAPPMSMPPGQAPPVVAFPPPAVPVIEATPTSAKPASVAPAAGAKPASIAPPATANGAASAPPPRPASIAPAAGAKAGTSVPPTSAKPASIAPAAGAKAGPSVPPTSAKPASIAPPAPATATATATATASASAPPPKPTSIAPAADAKPASIAPPAPAAATATATASAPPPKPASIAPAADAKPASIAPPAPATATATASASASAPPPMPTSIAPPAPPTPVITEAEPRRASVPPDGMVRTPSGRFVRGRVTGDELITALFEAMHDLHFLRDALDGGQFCLALATEALPSRAALIHFFDLDKREWVTACVRGKDTEPLLNMRTPEIDELLVGAARKRRAQVLPSAAEQATAERYRLLGGCRSLIVAPIMQAGRALGVLELVNPLDGMPFNEDEGNALTYIAEQYAEYLSSRGIVLDRDRIRSAAAAR